MAEQLAKQDLVSLVVLPNVPYHSQSYKLSFCNSNTYCRLTSGIRLAGG